MDRRENPVDFLKRLGYPKSDTLPSHRYDLLGPQLTRPEGRDRSLRFWDAMKALGYDAEDFTIERYRRYRVNAPNAINPGTAIRLTHRATACIADSYYSRDVVNNLILAGTLIVACLKGKIARQGEARYFDGMLRVSIVQ